MTWHLSRVLSSTFATLVFITPSADRAGASEAVSTIEAIPDKPVVRKAAARALTPLQAAILKVVDDGARAVSLLRQRLGAPSDPPAETRNRT